MVPKALVRDGQSLNAMWNRRQTTKFNGASYVIQRGAAAIYTPEGARQVEETIDYYRQNARVIKDALEACGYTVYGAVNSPYVWCETPGDIGSWEFFDILLERCGVITTPGSGFGRRARATFASPPLATPRPPRRPCAASRSSPSRDGMTE